MDGNVHTASQMKKLPKAFFQRKDVLQISRDLLGKILVTNWDGIVTAGRIVECEAYQGIGDKASHAAGGRRTQRNEIMYSEGGYAYVYLCYGLHHLFNVVTNLKNVPHAILIRALEPLAGIHEMLRRTGKQQLDYTLTRGPGNLSKALGISKQHNGIILSSEKLFIADDGHRYKKNQIGISARIGVEYAGEDALLPYRFFVKANRYVSGSKKQQS
jgi:DNA-3-methyladenine glycosylase